MLEKTDLIQILSDLENIAMNHIIEGIELGDDDSVIHVYTDDDSEPTDVTVFPASSPLPGENVCPVCGHWDTPGRGVYIEGVYAKQECHCSECETVFINSHRLVRQDIVSHPGR